MRTRQHKLIIGALCGALPLVVIPVLTSGASATTRSLAVPAASEPPIVLGNIGTYTGTGSSSQAGYEEGLQAWEKATNASGGIDGHPIQIIFQDDAGNPTTALTDVQKMVTQDHIVTLISPASATTSYMSYLNSQGVPALTASGFYGISPGLTLNASTSLAPFDETEATLAKLAGKTSYADMYCAEVTICASSDVVQKTTATKLGLKFTSLAEAESAPDYTAACLQLKSEGFQAVGLDAFTATDIRFAQDCVQQGYHPLWITVGPALTPQFLATPALSGIEVSLLDFPWFEGDSTATKAYQAALHKYLPGIQHNPLDYNANLAAAYAAGQVFTYAAEHSSNPLVIKDLLAGYATIKDNDFGGLTPPLTFGTPALLHDPSKYVQPLAKCFFAIQDHGGRWGRVTHEASYLACVH